MGMHQIFGTKCLARSDSAAIQFAVGQGREREKRNLEQWDINGLIWSKVLHNYRGIALILLTRLFCIEYLVSLRGYSLY